MKNDTNLQFVQDWINAWNSHDIDQIMSHYAEEINFTSPVIAAMGVRSNGEIASKEELRNYFIKALEKYPDLHFELINVLFGITTIALYYKSINNQYACELMELNPDGQVTMVKAHYTNPETTRSFIESWLAAWSGSAEKLVNYYHPNAVYSDPSLAEPLNGIDKLSGYFSALLRKFEGWKWELIELFDQSSIITIKWKATFLINGEKVITYGMDIVELSGGKIIRNEVYFDRTKLL